MKNIKSILLCICLFWPFLSSAQDIHFSQFFNSPMYQNVGNTGLMFHRDFRTYAQYRSQWGSIPAHFKTMSVGGDFQALRDDQFTNWLGIGFNFLNDKSGDGNLSLTQYSGSVAYHILLNESNLISFGMGASYNNRGIDFPNLSFDMQWDGYNFNKTLPNGESREYSRANYVDIQAGLNYSFIPNERAYFKIGGGMAHINKPKISFLGNSGNRLDYRYIGTFDGVMEVQNAWYINPSFYYTYMQGASELMVGAQVAKDLAGFDKMESARVFLGSYLRLGDAVVGLIGLDYSNIRITASYDATISKLKQANGGGGAFEFSIIYQGFYGNSAFKGRTPFECPRF